MQKYLATTLDYVTGIFTVQNAKNSLLFTIIFSLFSFGLLSGPLLSNQQTVSNKLRLNSML
jgi:hypothetical protein